MTKSFENANMQSSFRSVKGMLYIDKIYIDNLNRERLIWKKVALSACIIIFLFMIAAAQKIEEPSTIVASKIILKNKQGKIYAEFDSGENDRAAGITLYGNDGKARCALYTNDSFSALNFIDNFDQQRLFLGIMPDGTSNVILSNRKQIPVLSMSVSPDGKGTLQFRATDKLATKMQQKVLADGTCSFILFDMDLKDGIGFYTDKNFKPSFKYYKNKPAP